MRPLWSFMIALVMVAYVSPPARSQIVHVWDLAQSQTGQINLYNPDANDAQFGAPVSAGDLNGDGMADVILSAMAGDGPAGDVRSNAGEVHIYFSNGSTFGHIDFRFDHLQVVAIYGEAADDIFGIKSTVGDVDGDGLGDLLVGAFYADASGRADAGKLYIFSSQLLTGLLAGSRRLDLGAPFPSGVRTVTGPHHKSRLGVWMATGDINGDGVDDIVVGADMAHGANPAISETGRVYVLFGPLAPDIHIDTADTTNPAMSVIYGVDAADHAGSTVACGDVNGDGFADIIIGAAALGTLRNVYDRAGGAGDGPNNIRENAGEVYVVFGKPNLARRIDLRTEPPTDMLTLYGRNTTAGPNYSPDRFGEEIVTADVNGDHVADILIGAYRADSIDDSRRDGGEVYIVYGADTLPGQTIDMADTPSDVTVIYGSKEGAIAGDSIAAGDIHGDGYDDLFIGIPGDTGPNGRRSAGGIVVIAGSPSLPPVIDLASPAVPIIWAEGPDPADFSAYWAASGDVDGDGRWEAIPNGMAGDGPGNTRNTSGEAYILSGARLAEFLPAPVIEPSMPDMTLPETPVLRQNYPNPFNGGTTISYTLPAGNPARTILRLYNLRGQLIQTMMNEIQSAGTHVYVWDGLSPDGRPIASGVYICELMWGGIKDTKKLMIVK